MKGTEMIAIGTADHQGRKVFLSDGAKSEGAFFICGGRCIRDEALLVELDNFLIEEDRNNANSTNATVGLNGFDEGEEFVMVCMIVNNIALIICV